MIDYVNESHSISTDTQTNNLITSIFSAVGGLAWCKMHAEICYMR